MLPEALTTLSGAAGSTVDLPDRFLKDLVADPENAGELLRAFVADLDSTGRSDQAHRVLRTTREHAPVPEDRRHAAVELTKRLRASKDTKNGTENTPKRGGTWRRATYGRSWSSPKVSTWTRSMATPP